MSMLAERKRKQKWSLNPRGKEWSQDANKFGQKMLEKMGWQHGKGLGSKLDGVTEHVKISYKNDSKGMGYKETNDQWTEHESNFSALLESLTGKEIDLEKVKVTSLEQKSQISRARVHYHKFTRGKDLSRASEKDLANIFGRKSLKDTKKIKSEKESNSKDPEIKSNNLVNAGSMKDYFKKKIPNFGKINGYILGNNGVLKKEESDSESEFRPSFGNTIRNKASSESETEIKPSFGFGFNNTDDKYSKSKSTFVSFISENGDGKRKIEDNEDIILSPKKKSKKDKLKIKNVGLSNPSFNPMGTPIKVQKHFLDPIEESTTEDSFNISNVQNLSIELSSKKKKKSKDSNEFINPNFNEEINESLEDIKTEANPYEITTNKIKKNRKKNIVIEENTTKKEKKNEIIEIRDKILGLSNPAFNPMGTPIKLQKHLLDPIEESINEDSSNLSTKKKKSNKVTECSKEFNNNNFIEAEIATNKLKKNKKKNIAIEENTTKKEKKNESKEIRNENLGLFNPAFNPMGTPIKIQKHLLDPIEEIINEDSLNSSNLSTKKKKSNKVSDKEFINPNFIEAENESQEIETNIYEITTNKLKKKKKKKMDLQNSEVQMTKKEKKNCSQENDDIEDVSSQTKENTKIKKKYKNDEDSQIDNNPYEIKLKKNKKQRKIEVDNPNFDETEENVTDMSQLEDNPYEIKQTKKKKKSKVFSIDNPSFVDTVEKPIDTVNPYEVKSKKKQKKLTEDAGSTNPAIDLNNQNNEITILEDCDLMLNVVSTPIISKEETLKNRKSGKSKQKKNNGLDNLYFDKQRINLDENVNAISKTLDNYEAEIENGMNEEKMNSVTLEDLMVGEVGTPHGEHEKLPDGTKLKFKYANMDGRTPFYQLDKVGAKKSYKHLIKGDILVKFKNTNLHEIDGYAVKAKNKL